MASKSLFGFTASLLFGLSCVVATAADTEGPVVLSASSYDGRTIGLCFNEPLDSSTATNAANYQIGETNVTVAGARLRTDAQSVELTLTSPLMFSPFTVSVTNVLDLAGNTITNGVISGSVQGVSVADVGNPGVNPLEPGATFVCTNGAFEVSAGGGGFTDTGDGFYFVYQRITLPFFLGARVSQLEPANRVSKAGLMIREKLARGSRFAAVFVTPASVPARDGSGNGLNEFQTLYRDVENGPVLEWPGANRVSGFSFPDVWISLARTDFGFTAGWSPNGSDPGASLAPPLRPTTPYPVIAYIGLATTSNNNDPGFATFVRFQNLSTIFFPDGPPPLPINMERLGQQATISWPAGLTRRIDSTPSLTMPTWTRANLPLLVTNGDYRTVIELTNQPSLFFRLNQSPF